MKRNYGKLPNIAAQVAPLTWVRELVLTKEDEERVKALMKENLELIVLSANLKINELEKKVSDLEKRLKP
jgi:hypothetical protein